MISMHGCDQKNVLNPKIPFSSKVENFENYLILVLLKCIKMRKMSKYCPNNGHEADHPTE